MKKMGIEVPLEPGLKDANTFQNQKKTSGAPVPLNKVGKYCEGDEGNTSIPVEFNGVKSLAILDSGAGVAIATKQVWTSWGKPYLRKTTMKLQLVDGFMETLIGILEKVIVTSYGIEYEHNFEVILRRPFM